MTDVTITVESVPRQADIDALADGLSAHTIPIVGRPGFDEIGVFARDESGRLVGGVYGQINWNWLQVSLLWVNDEQRGTGLGSDLMNRLEALATEQGCARAHVDTFSFQARPFYERLGYEVFAKLDDYPPGHCRYYLRKALVDDAEHNNGPARSFARIGEA